MFCLSANPSTNPGLNVTITIIHRYIIQFTTNSFVFVY